jgi:UDPglucose 6-dehydrogenase
VPGADVDAVTAAIGVDRRISPYYLRGGPAYGGTCFPRDTRAFIALGERYDYEAALVRAAETINDFQHAHLEQLVLSAVDGSVVPRIGLLGLSFKSRTPVITESHMVKLAEMLLQRGLGLVVFDSLAIDNMKAAFGDRIEYARSPRECVEKSAVIVLGNQDIEYRDAIEQYRGDSPKTVIDCWRVIDMSKLGPAVDYVALGRASQEPVMARVAAA